MSGRVTVEKRGPSAILRFLNDDSGYMDDGTEVALGEAIDSVEADDSVRAVILTGGRLGVFIEHFDLCVLEARGRALAARGKTFNADRPVPETPLHLAFRRIEESGKPYLCAINGTAMGGGFELALCCDLRIAEDGPYKIGLPEINAGLLPGAGGTQNLPRLIGLGRALELLLLGKTVSPREAEALCLVHRCVSGSALSCALEIAGQLAAKPPRAIAHIKRLARAAQILPRDAGMSLERTLFCDLLVSPESIERMAALNAGKGDLRRGVMIEKE